MDETGFKFKVGDWAKTIGHAGITINDSPGSWRFGAVDIRYHIVERLYQECPGGVQRHYICRPNMIDGGIGREYIRMNEIELVAAEPFKEKAKEK